MRGMCNFLVNSVLVFIASISVLIATIVMTVHNVRIKPTYYIGMYIASSLFTCSSLTWILIYIYVHPDNRNELPPPSVEIGRTRSISSIHPMPSTKSLKEYVVTMSSYTDNVALGKSDDTLVIVTQP